MRKRFVIMIAAAGVVSFAGAFATGWLTRPAPATAAAAPEGTAAPGVTPGSMPPAVLLPTAAATPDGTTARSISEQQLNDLIYEVREKIQEYNRKLQDLEKEKERLQIAHQTLKKDIDALNSLHTDLAAGVASLKNERDLLLKTRVQVEQVEQSNLVAIAAAYDKMDPVRAGEILANMAQGPNRSGTLAKNTNADDAVKILFFMQERTKAKVLAELAASEPTLAAWLCQRLKQVTEAK